MVSMAEFLSKIKAERLDPNSLLKLPSLISLSKEITKEL